MYRKEAVRTARAALNWHEAEAHHIKKYLERAFDQARDDFIVDSSDSECQGCQPIRSSGRKTNKWTRNYQKMKKTW